MKKRIESWYEYEFPWDRQIPWETDGEKYWGNSIQVIKGPLGGTWSPSVKARRTAYKKILEIQKKIDGYNQIGAR